MLSKKAFSLLRRKHHYGIAFALIISIDIIGTLTCAFLEYRKSSFQFRNFSFSRDIIDIALATIVRVLGFAILLTYVWKIKMKDAVVIIEAKRKFDKNEVLTKAEKRRRLGAFCPIRPSLYWKLKLMSQIFQISFLLHVLTKLCYILIESSNKKSIRTEHSHIMYFWMVISVFSVCWVTETVLISKFLIVCDDTVQRVHREWRKARRKGVEFQEKIILEAENGKVLHQNQNGSGSVPLLSTFNFNEAKNNDDDDESDSSSSDSDSDLDDLDEEKKEGKKSRKKNKEHRKKKQLYGAKKQGAGASTMQLLKMSYPDLPWMLAAFFFLVIAALGQACIPYLIGEAINDSTTNKVSDHDQNVKKFQQNIYRLILVAVVTAVATGLRGSIFTLVMAKFSVRVRKELFKSLLKQEQGFFDVTKTGEITSRLASDCTAMSDQICLNLNVFLRSIVQAVSVLVFCFRLDVPLTILTFISVPAVVVISKIYGGYYRSLSKAVQNELALANSTAEEALANCSTVRSFNAEKAELHDYKTKLGDFYVVNEKMAIAYAGFACCFTFLPNLVTALVLYYGSVMIANGEMPAGDLIKFMLYQQNLSSSINTLGTIYTGLAQALGAADRVFSLINRKPKREPPGTISLDDDFNGNSYFHGEIELKDVDLYYPARPKVKVLKQISLKCPSGKVIALVGPSGGGKSSIIKLIQNLYEPQSGNILLDSIRVQEIESESFRKEVCIVSQEPVLFGRSIFRNIIYGLETLEDDDDEEEGVKDKEKYMDRVIEASKLANAHDFISALPQGYDTEVGEKGCQLSGGQKQRIAIARALVRSPKILLLDEATSALDAESEAVVQEALDRIMKESKRTVLVIAHRLSTVKSADVIFVIKDGQVVEEGNHQSLMRQKNGVYCKLVQRQLEKSSSEK
eukprot:g4606.t1